MTILNKKETESYLYENYTDEFYKEDKILTNDIVEKIYRTSAGDKEAINTLCKQYLSDPTTKREERSNYLLSIFFQLIGKSIRKFYKLGPLGMIKYFAAFLGFLLIVLIVLLYVFPSFEEYVDQIADEPIKITDEEMRLYKKYKIDLPENKKTKARGDKPPRLLSLSELTKDFPAFQEPPIIESVPPQLENNITSLFINNADNYGKSNETEDLSAELTSQIQLEKDDNSSEALKKSSIVVDDGSNIESNEKTENFKKDINWLVSQHPDKCVLQLLSAIKKETIANYLAFFGDTKESIIEFTVSIDDQKRYILLYGPFDNRDLAYAQIEKLPQKARQTKPWVRTIKSIKELVE